MINEIDGLACFGFVVVVNDGSGLDFEHLFEEIKENEKIKVINHDLNLGKGRALKTGFAWCYEQKGLIGAIKYKINREWE